VTAPPRLNHSLLAALRDGSFDVSDAARLVGTLRIRPSEHSWRTRAAWPSAIDFSAKPLLVTSSMQANARRRGYYASLRCAIIAAHRGEIALKQHARRGMPDGWRRCTG
jgi:hypothetical protein